MYAAPSPSNSTCAEADVKEPAFNSGRADTNSQRLEAAQREYGSALLAFAMSILREDRERAYDVVQDVFLKMHKHGADKIDQGRIKAWLFAVCRNRAIDILRKEKPMTITDASELAAVRDERPDPSVAAERREQHSQVLGMLERLPDNQREVVRLKFQSGLSYREIADVTKLSVGNVGFLLHGALKKLRKMADALPT